MSQLRVLFVDDDKELVSTVVERLVLRGIHASGATSGQRALNQLTLNNFDVVVLDIYMPELSGLAVLRQLKYVRPNARVILSSGAGASVDVDEGIRLGACEYLQKPVAITSLVKTIHRVAVANTNGGAP